MKRAIIVYNPAARHAPPLERLRGVADELSGEGWSLDIRPTHAAGEGSAIASEAAAAGASVVFACGGDGTINEVVNGLAGSETALGVLRAGMGNVLAKELGIPRSPRRALRLLLEGERRRFDLGSAGGRRFMVMAGVGFDGHVVRLVPPAAKRRLGSSSYVLWGLRELRRYRSRSVRFRADGVEREEELFWLLLANTRSYGGVIDIADHARVDDGLLDAVSFSGHGTVWLLNTAARVATHHVEGGGLKSFRVSRVDVLTPGLPVQADGEYVGETPMSFTVLPAALAVLVPAGRASRLFSSAAPSSRAAQDMAARR